MDLPKSKHLPIHLLSTVFRNTQNSYKFYWFLSILEHVKETGENRIPLDELIARMVAKVWYPVNYFRIFFGKQDQLSQLVLTLKSETTLQDDDNEVKVLDKILSILKTSKNSGLGKKLRDLTRYVPYRFVRPWFATELRGLEDYKVSKLLKVFVGNERNRIGELCLYTIIQKPSLSIEIPQLWLSYLQEHNKILQEFCLWNLVSYLQKNNPNVPNLSEKLFAPKARDLSRARIFWKIVLSEQPQFVCIYSNVPVSAEKFSIDHFIPWRFVTHDLLWNLIPTLKFINSAKSDCIPSLDVYFDRFAKIQHLAFLTVYQTRKMKLLEDYSFLFRKELKAVKNLSEVEFKNTLRSVLEPLVQIAANMGYESNWVYKK